VAEPLSMQTLAPFVGGPVVVDLMNTIWADRGGIHDALATDEEARSWVAAVRDHLGVAPEGMDAWVAGGSPPGLSAMATQLRTLRDAARRLAADETGDPRPDAQSPLREPADAVDVLNRMAAQAPTWPVLSRAPGAEPRRATRTDAGPGTAVVAALAGAAIDLFAGDGRQDLRACLAPGCVLYFVKQHPRREWCSSACGNRARVSRHYRRRHPAGSVQ
jgi:predicted RNA-binding Zn ribbon-like protein